MKRIFLQIYPFLYSQVITVLKDKQVIKMVQAPIEGIPEILCSLAKEYSITEIEVAGPSYDYAKKIEKDIKQKEIEKYKNNILTFKYI